MRKIVFASNNAHKLQEVRNKIGSSMEVLSMNEIGCFDDIPETAETFEGNAEIKARWIADKYQLDCFADDSGLCIDTLNGAPGVYSARYAGEGCTFSDNNKKVLLALDGIRERQAQFVTVICLIWKGKSYFFRGEVEGEIIEKLEGTSGFGYDPIFKPKGHPLTYAQMDLNEKNQLSHRAKALQMMSEFLQRQL